eukprot:TRINITY_DN8913_c0_g1_i1.p1 TRINITY_DN8913_c0_g1~~TRINITY_DN8913_c0_g1_i1.p1  ORF type:complete len:304 (-),score=120.30 TRINITY_DN8913_c0_g1_i1:295-1113(-)
MCIRDRYQRRVHGENNTKDIKLEMGKGNKIEEEDTQHDEGETMAEEKRLPKIRKKGVGIKKMRPVNKIVDEKKKKKAIESTKTPAAKAAIAQMLKKHKLKMEQKKVDEQGHFKPEVLREFQKEAKINPLFLTDQQMVRSRGQRKREEKKKKLVQKKVRSHWRESNLNQTLIFQAFNDYLMKIKQSKGLKPQTMNLDELKGDLKSVEDKIKEETLRKEKALKNGVSSKSKERIANEEVTRMQSILQFDGFLQNPLEAMKAHILNTQAKQKKKK